MHWELVIKRGRQRWSANKAKTFEHSFFQQKPHNTNLGNSWKNLMVSLVPRLFIMCRKREWWNTYSSLVPCSKILMWPIRLRNSAYITVTFKKKNCDINLKGLRGLIARYSQAVNVVWVLGEARSSAVCTRIIMQVQTVTLCEYHNTSRVYIGNQNRICVLPDSFFHTW